ncbi:MAG TPA: NUDIX domain-containing protein [Stellaceae bacterium]|nr:NUDIX domain-containing protein [Stellaceae bacterium]
MTAIGPPAVGPPAHPPLHRDVEIIERATGFARFLRIEVIRFRHRLFRGEWSLPHTYDVLRRGAAVAVVLYDPDHDRVVLVEQLRLPALLAGASPWQLEIVAGLVAADEPPERVAVRETREETGLALAGELVPIQRYLPSPGDSDESVWLYCARVDATVAAGVHGLPEEGEDIRVVVKSMAEVEAMLEAGAIENGHTLLGLYWLLRHRDRLRRMWGAG